MTENKKIQVILNRGAGPDGSGLLERINDLIGADSRWQVDVAHGGAEIQKLAESAAKSDYTIVVAAGGDGTVSTVAHALLGTAKVLGVLPVGTLNHFAKDLNIPLDLQGAIETINKGRTRRIDVAEVNGRTFINNSSLGLYPSIVKRRKKHQKLGMGKWTAFVWASWQVLRRFRLLDVSLKTDGETIQCRTPFVFVGNNQYETEGFRIGGRSTLADGKLSLYATARIGRLSLLWLALRGLIGGLSREKDFTALSATEIHITTRHKRLRVAADGEVTIMKPPLHYKVVPQALEVIVPEVEET